MDTVDPMGRLQGNGERGRAVRVISEWIQSQPHFLMVAGILSVLMFVGGMLVIPLVVARIPADYFLHRRPPPRSWRGRHWVIRLVVITLKNVLGLGLLAAGVAMLFLPGQGILSILIGLSLLDFPGKRTLELALVGRPTVLRAINWMRTRKGRDPLQLPPRRSKEP